MSEVTSPDSPSTETAPSVPSALLTVRLTWEAAGSKLPDAKAFGKLKDAYKQAAAKLAAAQAAAEATQGAVYAAARALAESVGGQSFKIDGIRHDFSSRGPNIFLRSRNVEKNILDI